MSTKVTHVQKICAYVTRDGGEFLVFEGPGHDGLQIPKGTIEPGEAPREALFREVREESGLGTLHAPTRVATDLWRRRPGRRYVRHFFHATVHEPRDAWTHAVTGEGAEVGAAFEFSWIELPTDREFALALDDYVHCLPEGPPTPGAGADDGDARVAGIGGTRVAGTAPRDGLLAPAGTSSSVPASAPGPARRPERTGCRPGTAPRPGGAGP